MNWQADLLRALIVAYEDHPLRLLLEDPHIGAHLAVMDDTYMGLIEDKRKIAESRWSANCIAPYGDVRPGDLLVFKLTGGQIKGLAQVEWFLSGVLDSDSGSRSAQVRRLLDTHGDNLGIFAGDMRRDFRSHLSESRKRYFTIMYLLTYHPLPNGVVVPCEKRDRRGWVVLRMASPHTASDARETEG